MKEPLRVGLVGLDTSHAVVFSKCFNKPGHTDHVDGAKVVAAFPGGSRDFELSWSRVEKFTKQVRDDFGVTIMDSPEAVADACDLLFIIAADGRTHLDFVRRTIALRKPTFIDKPLAVSSSDAREIARLFDQHHLSWMSCSSLRYAPPLTAALADDALGKVVGVDVFGPMHIEPTQGGLFWYGIHTVEMLNRVMGGGVREVRATKTETHDVVVATWPDGRIGTVHGVRGASGKFGATIHREKGIQFVDAYAASRSPYAAMLEAIVRTVPQRRSDVDAKDTLEIIRLIEAANESRDGGPGGPGGGKTVTL